MSYLNSVISFGKQAYETLELIQTKNEERGRAMGKFVTTHLYENRYKITKFLPEVSVASLACIASITYLAAKLFNSNDERGFAELVYKHLPEGVKIIYRLKTAKIITITAVGVTAGLCLSNLVFSIQVVVFLVLVPPTIGFTALNFMFPTHLGTIDYFLDAADIETVDNLNRMMNAKNEAEAIKLLDQLCLADLKGSYYVQPSGTWLLINKAASLGLSNVIEALVEKGCVTHVSQQTLQYAVHSKNVETVKTLIKHYRADLDIDKGYGLAYESDCPKIMEYFIFMGYKMDSKRTLANALLTGKVNVVKWLVEERGVLIKPLYQPKEIYLQRAVANKHTDLADYLLERFKTEAKSAYFAHYMKVRAVHVKEGIPFEILRATSHLEGYFREIKSLEKLRYPDVV